MDRWADGWTNRPMDKASYRDAWTHLKTEEDLKNLGQLWLHFLLKIKMAFVKSHFPNKGKVISTLFGLEH